MSDLMWGGESGPLELIGGPCDGQPIDGNPYQKEVWPGPHHLEACGLTHPVVYVRRDEPRKFYYDAARSLQAGR